MNIPFFKAELANIIEEELAKIAIKKDHVKKSTALKLSFNPCVEDESKNSNENESEIKDKITNERADKIKLKSKNVIRDVFKEKEENSTSSAETKTRKGSVKELNKKPIKQ